ncbi:MAG: hypothetical protein KIT56_01860 [Gammaproteobacteria bacterium]|nr:hypothetical protein [Gammaproteobacteria bacterium]MCW5582629.1 hypothetical protein [Gammaproteobacteria bacterium]
MQRKEKKKYKVFTGKHGEYTRVGMFQQGGGSVPKVRSEAKRVSGRSQNETISFIEKQELGKRGDVVKEKICLDFYKVIDRDLTPSCRIALQQTEYMRNLLLLFFTSRGNDNITSTNLADMFLQAAPTYGDEDPRYATFIGKVVNGYRDLGDEFVAYIEQYHRPPNSIRYGNQEYFLDGIMEIAAISKILGDPDWLGGSGSNTGYVIEGDRAKAVFVDAGLSLSDFARLGADSRNIQVGNSMPASSDIYFDELTESQKKTFIGTLYKFIHCENLPCLIEFLVKREDAFNSQKDKDGNPIVLLDEETASTIINKIMQNIATLSQTYQRDLREYQKLCKDTIIPIDEFNINIPSESNKLSIDNSLWWPMLMIGVGIASLGVIFASPYLWKKL